MSPSLTESSPSSSSNSFLSRYPSLFPPRSRKIHSAEILTILASTFCPALNCTGFTKLPSNSSAKLSSSLISSNFSLSSSIQAFYLFPELNLQSIHFSIETLQYAQRLPREQFRDCEINLLSIITDPVRVYSSSHALSPSFLPFEAELPEIGAQLCPVPVANRRAVVCSNASLGRLCGENHAGGPAAFPAVGLGKEPQNVHHFGPGHPFKAGRNLRPPLPDRVDLLS